MKIVQWNIRGYYGNIEDLKLLIKVSGFPSVVCLQETLIGDKNAYPPSRYFIYPSNRHNPESNRSPRGIATLIHKKIPHSIANITTNLEAQAIRIHLNRTYTIANIYISPQEQITARQMHDIINQLSPPYLIIGDYNARSPTWGDSVENTHGRVVEDFLLNSDCAVMNTGAPTHYHVQTNTESCFDVSLCSPGCLLNFTWTVL